MVEISEPIALFAVAQATSPLCDNSKLKMTTGVDTSWGVISWEQTFPTDGSYIEVNILNSGNEILEQNVSNGYDLSQSLNIESTDDIKIQIKFFTLEESVQIWNIRLKPKVTELITTAFKNKVLQILMGDSSDQIDYWGVGTGTTAAQAGDTSLQTPVLLSGTDYRKAIQTGWSYNPATSEVQVEGYMTTTEANGNDLSEFGLFTASTAGTMINRVVFDPESKTSDIEYYFTITLKVGD